MRADRWACRLVLMVEALAVAWTLGRLAASPDPRQLNRLVLVAAVTVASVIIALVIHGRAVLGLVPRDRES